MYNRVIIMGRITHDLEVKTTPNGVAVLTFSVACDRRYQADKQNKVTDFFNCVAWRNDADFIARYFGKGKCIIVEGELQNRRYTDKKGIERVATEIIVERAGFTGERSERSGADSRGVPPPDDSDYPYAPAEA